MSRLIAILLALGATAQSRDAAPPVAFADEVPPPAPDYADPANWAARPERPGVAADVPAGLAPPPRDPPADVFYIHPTTYRSARWNADVADDQVNAWTDVSVVQRQASIFNACCRVFAPRYRQASGRAFAAMAGDGMQAYRLAYADVERAFDQYIANDNRGRPFIIAGHSQGALQAMFLLRARIDGTPLQRQLIAAYIVGIGVSLGELATLPTLKPCATPDATGCMVSWNAFVTGSDTSAWTGRSASAYPGQPLLCTNPLTFDLARPVATANPGALPGRPLAGPLAALKPDATGADCTNGALFATPAPSLGITPLPGGSLHMDDMSLFYASIRANALARTRAWLKERR